MMMATKVQSAGNSGGGGVRKAAAGIDVSAGLLERVRGACCGGEESSVYEIGSGIAANKEGGRMGKQFDKVEQALLMCIEEVLGQGFGWEDAKECMISVLREYLLGDVVDPKRKEYLLYEVHGTQRSASSLAGVLSMLVMNELLCKLSRDELPSYYADSSKTLDQAQVKQVYKASERETAAAAGVPCRAVDEEMERQREREKQKEREIQDQLKVEKEKQWNESKAWILQQAYDDDESSVEEEEEACSSDGGSIEDWEVWGDPEEIDRKRAETSREKLSREDKIAIIAYDMFHAKQHAASAKAGGDKAGQKEAGAIIGKLRREMKDLDISDGDLEPLYPSEDAVVNRQQQAPSQQAESQEEEEEFQIDMFDTAMDEPDEPTTTQKLNTAYLSIISNQKLRESIRNKKEKKKNKTNAGVKQVVKKHPKAVLQQAMQKEGWSAPRFEKLPNGGERNVQGPQYRFQICIDVRQSKHRRHRIRIGTHKFALEPQLDGWDTIQMAQDACATKALMDLYGNSTEIEWEVLKEPFDELLLEIAEFRDVASTQVDDGQEKEEFVASLLKSFSRAFSTLDEDDEDDAFHLRKTALLDQTIVSSIEAKKLELKDTKQLSEQILGQFNQWIRSETGSYWMEKRNSLPVFQIQDGLLQSLETHDVVLVSGETGSGKTTQVPQMVLDGCIQSRAGAECNIVCTQPRRIAAISVAERVSEERGEDGPGTRGSVVGYSVRFDTKSTAKTRLEFCTTGILLRRLSSDPALAKFSHIIVDEVHERSMQSDFLIAMLRDLVHKRRMLGMPLKVILMSATMNTEMVADYFSGCPILSASGRTFPVKHLFLEDIYETTNYILGSDSPASLREGQMSRAQQKKLENSAGSKNKALIKGNWGDGNDDVILNPHFDHELYEDYSVSTLRNLAKVNEDRIDMDLLENVVLYIHETQDPGAILVFVPGMAEIDNLSRRLLSQRMLQSHVIVPLHSSISPRDQKRAFKVHPPGIRKIVISTNIAETSVTIEDIVYVVDTGKLKERRYDASRSMSMLIEDSVSVANANQRKGRAGRVREGTCYSLYTRACFEGRMKKYQTPEIMRVPLEEMILQIHNLKLSDTADGFLSRVLQPPLKKAVQGAIQNLVQAGALTKQEDLTPLGCHLAQLPVDINIGKILIMGSLLNCLSPVLSIAACLSHKSPFVSIQDKDEMKAVVSPFLSKERKCIASEQQSDHLVLAAALQGWIDASAYSGKSSAIKYAGKFKMSVQNINIIMEMRDQFATMLYDIGLAQKPGPGQDSFGFRWYDSDVCPQNLHKSSSSILRSVLVASLYPRVALMDQVIPGSPPTWHDGNGPVAIHPSSILSSLSAGNFQQPFVVYSEKMKTSKVFLRDCSVASPLSIFLFGKHVHIDHKSSQVIVDGWIRIKVAGRCASILFKIRERLDEVLQARVKENQHMTKAEQTHVIMELVAKLLAQEQQTGGS